MVNHSFNATKALILTIDVLLSNLLQIRFPLTFGWRVCMQPPCTDEKRIALKAGDQVAVTRWKRYSAVWQAKLALVTKL